MPAISAGRHSTRVSALRWPPQAASSWSGTHSLPRPRSRWSADPISVSTVPSSATVIDNLDFSGFIGGSGEDGAFWVAVDGAGDVYVVGDTASTPFTFPDGDGIFGLTSFGSDSGGGFDAFLMKLVVTP